MSRDDEVLQAIRAAQEASLTETSFRLIAEQERRERRAAHEERIRTLRPIVRRFLRFMATNGNPGVQRFGKSYLISPATHFKSPRYEVRKRGPWGWPMAVVVNWLRYSRCLPPHPSEPRAIIALDVDGNWWHGSMREDDPPYVIRQVRLAELDKDAGYCFVQRWQEPYLSIDLAVIGSIGEVCDANRLVWPWPSKSSPSPAPTLS